MRKLAIIAPCILPVPASKGGAVEELITCIIDQNEISQSFAIDLYTIADFSCSNNYSFTNIIPIELNSFTAKIDRVSDKFYRTFSEGISAKRLYDKSIIKAFMEHWEPEDSYYAVIVENQMSTTAELLKATAGVRDFPIYFHMHNDVDVYRSPDYIRMLTAAGVQFIAVSNYIKKQIRKYDNNAVVEVLYNGIDFDAYKQTTRTADENVKFLYAGRIIPDKGVLELVKAFNLFLEQSPSEVADRATLDIIGFSEKLIPYEKKVLEEIKKNPSRISCQKRLSTSEMALRYNEYDAVIMPTIAEEPFGLVALETIAKGIPLITTNSGAIPEVVGDGALIVDKNSDIIHNLSKAICEFSTNINYRIETGKKGYNKARNDIEFNINSYYDRLVRIISSNKYICVSKVSVIVPAFNVEKYLKRCIESLINQTHSNLEIIIVDDGSTDYTGQLCDNYAAMDSRITVVHQENKGLSAARNAALDRVTGDYIFFVDSDDYIESSAISEMLEQATQSNSDVVACGFSHVFDDKPEILFTSTEPGFFSGRESVIQMMRNNNVCTVAWSKLYKSNLWDNIRFPEGHVHEDEATIYKVLYKAKLVRYMPNSLYKYYQRENSVMNAGLKGRCADFLSAIEERISFFKEQGDRQLVEHSVISLLEYIKYIYRNAEASDDEATKVSMEAKYRNIIGEYGAPGIAGAKKKIALLLWNYFKY
ncbi:glycosyltransferase [Pseudobutyrivibrio xylanivorans]|uniref:Glycosyl transferase GT4/GT2 n=1 Tax=Pseudobutyrivibrio xylanivorans TaxID=185007 RepID=A0A5P6VRS3_PSEXY|nr:glycosyltransferase [Pseudobutyrivibrio xylanivorans]QFJ53914.1 glycosyl transferase GT4/GT2 [Pseudobutyrivibrio xylanivorans]